MLNVCEDVNSWVTVGHEIHKDWFPMKKNDSKVYNENLKVIDKWYLGQVLQVEKLSQFFPEFILADGPVRQQLQFVLVQLYMLGKNNYKYTIHFRLLHIIHDLKYQGILHLKINILSYSDLHYKLQQLNIKNTEIFEQIKFFL